MIDLDDPKGHTVDALHAEIRRLRSLPVLPTCSDCTRNDYGRCVHPDALAGNVAPESERDRRGYALVPYDDRTGDYLAPPTWCPFRGEKR